MTRPTVAAFAGAVVSLLLAGAALGAAGVTGSAPDFTRNDLDGKALHLADLRGKVVLLNFWATWCGPCIEEMPVFAAWQRQYEGTGLQVVGISMDDDAKDVRRFLVKTPVGYPVVMGDTALARQYGGVLGLPVTYLLDRRGEIVDRYTGAARLGAMEARIQSLLAH